MGEEFDLSTISERSGIELRKIRYCVDHELVPQRSWFLSENEAGRPRRFDSITAVFLVCAALLLESGIKREAVKSLMRQIGALTKPGRNPLNLPLISDAFARKVKATIRIGDGSCYRWQISESDSGWLSTNGKLKAIPEFTPSVVIELNLGVVRDALLRTAS